MNHGSPHDPALSRARPESAPDGEWSLPDRFDLIVFGAILLVGLALRLAFLFQPMRYDEAYTYIHWARQPLLYAVSEYSAPNNHIFHTVLTGVATRLLGSDPWVIRLPALAAGVLLIPAAYIAIRRLVSNGAGLIAAAFAAGSPCLVLWSTNARGYSLVCLLFLILLLLAKHIADTRSTVGSTAFVVAGTLSLWTIPTGVFGLAVILLWILLTAKPRDPERNMKATAVRFSILTACICVLTALLYSPVVLRWGLRRGASALLANKYVEGKGLAFVFSQGPASIAATWNDFNRDVPGAGQAILGMLCVLGLWFLHTNRADVLKLFAAIPIAVLTIIFVKRVIPFERTWTFLMPLYFGLAGAGVVRLIDCCPARIRQRKSRICSWISVAIALLLAGRLLSTRSVLSAADTGTLPEAESITRVLSTEIKPGDRVFSLCPSDAPLAYYFMRANLSADYLALRPDDSLTRVFLVVNDRDQTLDAVLEYLSKRSDGRLPEARLSQLHPILLHRFPGASVYLLEPAGQRGHSALPAHFTLTCRCDGVKSLSG